MTQIEEFEIIIIGGSYAGLSAGMALGRSLRKVLIIDEGKPCNRQTPKSHNFLTQDGSTPQEITEIARNQVARYDTVKFYDGLAVGSNKVGNRYDITTSRGDTFHTKKIILATGIKDLMPGIDGFSECWGISLVHCPYCHGFEIRNRKTAILANGDTAVHLVSLVNNLTNNITILTEGRITIDDQNLQKLSKHEIKIIDKKILAIEHKDGKLNHIRFEDDSLEAFDAAYASIPFEQNTFIPEELGCKLTEQGYIEVDEMGKTTVDGVYACGDCSTMMRSVATAVFKGNIAGVFINHELTQESF